MQKHTVLRDVLAFGAEDAVAIAAPASKPMTFKRLRQQIEETAQALAAFGAGSKDRVAIVLPNGPEMAAAFLSVASNAASAPLNPSYKAEEFEFYLSRSRRQTSYRRGGKHIALHRDRKKARRQDREPHSRAGSGRGQLHPGRGGGWGAGSARNKRPATRLRLCFIRRVRRRGPKSCR